MIKRRYKPTFYFLSLITIIFVGCVAAQPIANNLHTDWEQNKRAVINDTAELVSADFSVPDNLKSRVSFWMDIYGKYSSSFKVIHDSRYPWVVYEVVDITQIKSPAKYMKQKVQHYRRLLKDLRYKKNPTDLDKKILQKFSKQPGYIKKAYRNVRYQTGQKDNMRAGIERSMMFLPHMEEIFLGRDLPVELTRLPFVESSFNLKAFSKVGARGIWQFMRGTGRKFMKINRYIDERDSPLKATVAAAKLLKQNHKILKKNWPLAVTAYNHGPGGLIKASRIMKTNDLGVIADNYKSKRFSFASANFYASFLAALYVERYKDRFFDGITFKSTPKIIAHKTKRGLRARSLLKQTKLTKDDFLAWNPDLRKALRRNYKVPRNFIYYKPLEVLLTDRSQSHE